MDAVLGGWPVRIDLPVLWGDMDALGHVNNTVYLRWFESARIEYFEKLGLWADMKQSGVGPILARATVDYRRALHFPDTISVEASTTSLGRSSFVIAYRLRSKALCGEIAAEGESVNVLFRYPSGPKVELGEDFKARVYALESGQASPR